MTDWQSPITRDLHIIAMARPLAYLADCESRVSRAAAYVRAGYSDAEILEHDAECLRRERIRRALFGGRLQWRDAA